jgi:hypothetical protein
MGGSLLLMAQRKTVIDVLDQIFDDRDYDLRLLAPKEFEKLSLELTIYASNYEAPPRSPGRTRYYGGGNTWHPSPVSGSAVWFGTAGLRYGPDVEVAQTLCLIHDSVVCHDCVTDFIGRYRTDFLPSYHEACWCGEKITDSELYGDKPSSGSLIDEAAVRLNAILRIYDMARELIQKGYLILVPTRVLLKQSEHAVLTQMRHAAHDEQMLQIAGQSKTVPVSDGIINQFVEPVEGTKLAVGPADHNPGLRLHYGIMHHIKCLLVAHKALADYAPPDDFGWRTMEYKWDQLFESLSKKSSLGAAKIGAQSSLAVPIVRGFTVSDIVSIRRDEEIFEELRGIIGKTVDPILGPRGLDDFYADYDRQAADALDRWRRVIQTSPKQKGLFRNIATATAGCIGVAAVLAFATDSTARSIQVAAGLPGLYYALKDLLLAGLDPSRRLFKVLRRYSFPEDE